MTASSNQNYILVHLRSVGETICLFSSHRTQDMGFIQVVPAWATEPLIVVNGMLGASWSTLTGLCVYSSILVEGIELSWLADAEVGVTPIQTTLRGGGQGGIVWIPGRQPATSTPLPFLRKLFLNWSFCKHQCWDAKKLILIKVSTWRA